MKMSVEEKSVPPSMKQRIYSLDIIRGLAAVAVFLSHLGNNISKDFTFHQVVGGLFEFQHYLLWCNGGLHWGVIVFIVLSGFCIHMPAAKKGVEKILIPYYARRRFFRIFPVLVVAMLFGFSVFSLQNGLHLSSLLNLMISLSLAPGVIHFSGPLGNEILLTVIVECLLYAIYPFIFPKNKKQWLYIFAGALAIHFLNFSLVLFTEINPSWVQRNLFSFILYWWIGAYFAEITFNAKLSPELKRIKIIAWVNDNRAITLLLVYAIYVVASNMIFFKGSHVLKSLYLAVMTGYFLLHVSKIEIVSPMRLGKRKVVVQFMSTIGGYSYSLYVLHIPIITLLSMFAVTSFFKGTPLFYLINIIAVIISTIIFFKVIEKPSHNYAAASSNKALQRALLKEE